MVNVILWKTQLVKNTVVVYLYHPKGYSIMKYLKSRTVITAVVMFLFNGLQAIEQSIPQDLYIAINGLLTIAIGYFRINTRVK